MRPALTTNDPMALLSANAIDSSQLCKGDAPLRISFSDGLYGCVIKFCHAVFCAFLFCKSIARMQNIALVCAPLKITYMIVCGVVIQMVNLVTQWGRAYKDRGDQLVNKNANLFAILVKLNSLMTILPMVWGKVFASADAKDISKVRDFVNGFVARNGHPDFFHTQPLLVDRSVSVAWQLAQKPAFRSYPSQAGEF